MRLPSVIAVTFTRNDKMAATALVFLAMATNLHGANSDFSDPLVLMGKQSSPSLYSPVGVPSALSSIELVFQVKPSNLASLNLTAYVGESNSMDSSLGPNYLSTDLLAVMEPNPAGMSTVSNWLEKNKLIVSHMQGFLINAYGPLPTWESVLNATFLFYENVDAVGVDRRRLIRTAAYYLPQSVADAVLIVYNTVRFPDVPYAVQTQTVVPGPTHNTTGSAAAPESPAAIHVQSVLHTDEAKSHLHIDQLPLPKEGFAKVVSLDGEGHTINVFYMQDGKLIPGDAEHAAGSLAATHPTAAADVAAPQGGTLLALFHSMYTWVASWLSA